MQRKVQHAELEPEYLDIVAGGRSRILADQYTPGEHIKGQKPREPSHYFKTLSDPIEGATLAEANDLLNRYNTPTNDALWGNGNDPHATQGWVPAGSVAMTRGEHDGHAWVTNTADALHLFHGTTTRTVVDSPEGYRILTVGEGHGTPAIPGFTELRHEANAYFGPGAFQQLDENMMRHWKPHAAHDDAQPHADPAREQPQSGANQ
jgi:hypothetical protein